MSYNNFEGPSSSNYIYEGLGQVNGIIQGIQRKVGEILNFDKDKVDSVFAVFMDGVRERKDSHGRANPRTVRSFLHSYLPSFKKSPAFMSLNTFEQKTILKELNKVLHKN